MSAHFTSDNTAGAHPAVLEAVARAATGHALPYGADQWTERATTLLRESFGADAVPFLVTTGTAANVLALDHVTRPHHAVVCPSCAHIALEECSAPERYAGLKLVTVPTAHGKLVPEDVRARLVGIGDEHRAQPRVVSISEATEVGTVYSASEIAALADTAHADRMLLHVDGARLANAAASLGVPVRALTRDAGVDVVTVGFTKAGGMLAEAVVFLRPGLADEFAYARKQGMQLVSKMRFVSAQVVALLEGDLWLDLAGHANAMARMLADALEDLVEVVHPVEANAVFARVEPNDVPALRAAGAYAPAAGGYGPWEEETMRWMTAWDTTLEEVTRFAEAIRAALS